jgi:hypothetical protein
MNINDDEEEEEETSDDNNDSLDYIQGGGHKTPRGGRGGGIRPTVAQEQETAPSLLSSWNGSTTTSASKGDKKGISNVIARPRQSQRMVRVATTCS